MARLGTGVETAALATLALNRLRARPTTWYIRLMYL